MDKPLKILVIDGYTKEGRDLKLPAKTYAVLGESFETPECAMPRGFLS